MSKHVLALDPSKKSTGYAVIEAYQDVIDGTEVHNYRIEDCGTIATACVTNPLGYIRAQLSRIVRHHPGIAPVVPKEALFFRNHQTTKTLAAVHAVIKQSLADLGYDIVNINPKAVKRVIAGYGNATKEQVAAGVREFCNLPPEHQFITNDVSDAAAVALTYLILTDRKSLMNV